MILKQCEALKSDRKEEAAFSELKEAMASASCPSVPELRAALGKAEAQSADNQDDRRKEKNGMEGYCMTNHLCGSFHRAHIIPAGKAVLVIVKRQSPLNTFPRCGFISPFLSGHVGCWRLQGTWSCCRVDM